MLDNFYTKQEARDKLVKGIEKCVALVGGTMGTRGKNIVIEAIESPGHLTTNDGETILRAIKLADPVEEMARKILLEAVSRANKLSGDGSSTTCVLTGAILIEGLKHLENNSVMDIKRSLEECIPLIEESIKAQTREITVDEVGAVASISAEDEKVGAMIQEIYQKIGKDGIIHWDISKTPEDIYTIGSGITIDGAGFVSPYMCDATELGQNTNQIRLKNPHILITKQKITSASEFNDIGITLNNKEIKDLVVFCDDFDPLVIADLVKTRMMRGFRFILVKMPVLWKDWWFEDLSRVSQAKIVDNNAGLPMKEVKFEHLGKVGNIIITKDITYIDGIAEISSHIKSLEEDASDSAKLRISRLNTKTARYFVGAHSDSALSYKRLKVEDAISSAWQSLQGGVVAGGGIALLNCASALSATHSIGADILFSALRSPLKQILENAGIEHKGIIGMEDGYDTRTREIVNMFQAGIIDASPIVLNACKNAISVAASILTAEGVVLLPREEGSFSQRKEALML